MQNADAIFVTRCTITRFVANSYELSSKVVICGQQRPENTKGGERPDRASKPSFSPEKMAGQALSFDRGRPASLDALSQPSCDDNPFCVPSLSVS
jgi:hypothetical protein